MKFSLGLGPLDLPEANFQSFLAPLWPAEDEEPEDLVRLALDAPVASPTLRELYYTGRRALILIEDQTRPTPLLPVLPALLESLEWGGIERKDIRIAVAGGCHRPMSASERSERLGEFARSIEVIDHHPDHGLVFLGNSPRGIPLFFNAALFESDLVISVGRIAPHRVTGFSGGTSLLALGLSGRQTIADLHWLSALSPSDSIMGRRENPVLAESDAMAGLLHLDFGVSVILNGEGHIVAAYAGDPAEAHREGCRRASEIYALPPSSPLIVVCEPSPDQRMIGAFNPLYSAERLVAEGGVVVLADPHLQLDPATRYPPLEEVIRSVESGMDKLLASHQAHVAWAKQRARVILVSPTIEPVLAEQGGFFLAETPQEAIELAFELAGSEAKVSLLWA